MPSRLGPFRRGVREIGLGLITLGVIVLLFVGYQLFGTNLTEARNQSQLKKQFTTVAKPAPQQTGGSQPGGSQPGSQQAGGLATTSARPDVLPSVPPGGAIDHLVIPAIGVDKYIVEGTAEADLRRGPGHYSGTPYPGQSGNVAIAGHRTTYGAPFFELNGVHPGDLIELTDLNDRTWDYIVSRPPEVVSPNDVSVLNPTPFPQLTLTTCNPRFSAATRLVVVARLRGQAGTVNATPLAASPQPRVLPGDTPGAGTGTAGGTGTGGGTGPAAVAGTDLGQGRASAWGPSLFYGLLVVLLWIGTRLAINRTRGRYRVAAYVIGIGLCLIPLWFCFENVILLLPQSI